MEEPCYLLFFSSFFELLCFHSNGVPRITADGELLRQIGACTSNDGFVGDADERIPVVYLLHRTT